VSFGTWRLVRRSVSWLATLGYATGFTLACSSAPSEPRYARVTIRVENTACDAVACAPLSVVGLPKDQPVLPDGPWFILLGTMRSPTACFSFPLLDTFTFQDQQGIVEHLVWHNGDSVAIGTFPESSGYSQTKRITGLFVPNRAPGWHLTVPAGTDLVTDSACTSPAAPAGDMGMRR
jgi:hypothetical protein